MKVFVPVLCLMALVRAEPPVSDGYPAARSSDHHHSQHDHHDAEHQRSLSEYGPPSNTHDFSTGYSGLNSRTAHSFSPPTARVSFSQRFGSASRSNQGYAAAARSLSQDYSAPNSRSGISQEYGAPNTRSLSQEYGVPSIGSARAVSNEYGLPEARFSPSQVYGAPAAQSNQNFHGVQLTRTSSQEYSAPAARSQFQVDAHVHAPSTRFNYDGKSDFSRSSPSSTYGAPSRSLSASYGVPVKDSDSYSQEHHALSQTYGAPEQRDLSETYGAPNARGLSQEYGAPSGRANLKPNAQTSYASSRSHQPSSYLSARSMPSEQYGLPEQRDGGSQGYDYAKARALDELLNQEPANYDFTYEIEDNESGSDFGHTETRLENRAEGAYFVVLPDGTKQTVEYEADEGGFKPRISVEPVGGYDVNAADISRSAGGPY